LNASFGTNCEFEGPWCQLVCGYLPSGKDLLALVIGLACDCLVAPKWVQYAHFVGGILPMLQCYSVWLMLWLILRE